MGRKIVHIPRCLVISIFAVLGSTELFAERAQPVTVGCQEMAAVKGTVLDSNGAVIITPRPSITFEGKQGVKSAATKVNGRYFHNFLTGRCPPP